MTPEKETIRYDFAHMGTAAVVWQTTGQVRWWWPSSSPEGESSRVLQQLWVSDRGEREWKDVPVKIAGNSRTD